MSRPSSPAATLTVRVVRPATGIVVLVLAYELLRQLRVLPPDEIPSSRAIAGALRSGISDGSIPGAVGSTLQAAVEGVALAAALGIILGVATGLSRWVEAVTSVAVDFLRPIPVIALVPIAIVVFGLQLRMQVFLVAVACLWPVLIGTRHAVRAIDPLLLDTGATLGLSRPQMLRRILLPACVPGVLTSVRTSASLGIVVAVAAELVAGSPGLGNLLVESQSVQRTDSAFACVVMAGLVGVVVNVGLVLFENHVAAWQRLSTEGRR